MYIYVYIYIYIHGMICIITHTHIYIYIYDIRYIDIYTGLVSFRGTAFVMCIYTPACTI